jgi:protein-S-isoprenylcysteine O-methyltransferase Ste14
MAVVAYALAAVTSAGLSLLEAVPPGEGRLLGCLAGMAVGVAGILLGGWAVASLGRGVFGAVRPVAGSLMQAGPYRYVRHPLYVGVALVLIGLALGRGSGWGMAAAICLFVPSAIWRARCEERAMAKSFGREWAAYRQRVGFMFPQRR